MSRPQRFPAEPVDQFMYVARALHDAQGRCVLEFDEQVDAERLERAVRLTLEVEPILGCRFVEHPWRPYWQLDDRSPSGPFLSCFRPADMRRELYRFMAEPIEPARSPQLRVGLFRSGHDTVCVKLNHMIADAGGLLDYVALLAATYRHLESDPDYQPILDAWSGRGQGQVLSRIGAGRFLHACRRFSLPPSAWGFPSFSVDCSDRTFSTRQLGSEHLAAIRDCAHHFQVTVSQVLLTAFNRALFNVALPPEGVPLPMAVTMNLRRYLDAGCPRAICNLTGIFFPGICYRRGETFEETLRQVNAVIGAHQADESWVAQTLYIESIFKLGFMPVRWLADYLLRREVRLGKLHPFFANIGNIALGTVDFGQAQVAGVSMFGPVTYPPGCTLTISSFCGTMNLTTSYCASATDPCLVEQFLDRVIQELPD